MDLKNALELNAMATEENKPKPEVEDNVKLGTNKVHINIQTPLKRRKAQV